MKTYNGYLNSKTVLVVDDDPDILDAVAFILHDAGYVVKTTPYAYELENLPQNLHPDVIVLDVLLSGADGREIARKLKSRQDTRSIPIIMISAHPSAVHNAKQYGADEFLPKPFDIDDLLGTIERHTKQSH